LNDSDWSKEVQRRRAIKQREMFGKALKCLPVCSFYDPVVVELDGVKVKFEGKPAGETEATSIVEIEDGLKAGADERSAVSVNFTESASISQNKPADRPNVTNATESPFAMTRTERERLLDAKQSNHCASSTLADQSNDSQLILTERAFAAITAQSGSSSDFHHPPSTGEISHCDLSVSGLPVEQIEIGSSVEISGQEDQLESRSPRIPLPGLINCVAPFDRCSPFTSNENTCDDQLSHSSSERFPITSAAVKPAEEHPYACSGARPLPISSIDQSSIVQCSRLTEKQMQRLKQEKMNDYFSRANGTGLLKQNLFQR
jgi:hypothetical protein